MWFSLPEIEDYAIRTDRQNGRLKFSRISEEPPERIVVSLELVQSAMPGLIQVNRDELHILNDCYRIVGWLPDRAALDCLLVHDA